MSSAPAVSESIGRGAVRRAAFLDRWAYTLIVAGFVLIAFVGFAPRSLAVLTGERPNPAWVIHLHAAAMALWFALLLAQAWLVAMGKRRAHRTLGVVGVAAGPLLLITMGLAAWHFFEANVEAGSNADAARAVLIQGRAVVYYALFFGWALLVRRRDAETHKRMVLLATVALLPAALSRMTWLPTGMPHSFDGLHAYMLCLLLPGIVHDWWRYGRPHAAYLRGIACFVPWIIATHVLWNSPWWLGLPGE